MIFVGSGERWNFIKIKIEHLSGKLFILLETLRVKISQSRPEYSRKYGFNIFDNNSLSLFFTYL